MLLSACRGGLYGRDFLMRLCIWSVYHPVEGHGVDELVSVCQGVGARMLADVLCEPCGCIANLSCVRVLIRRSGTGAPSVTGASIAARTLVLHKHHYWFASRCTSLHVTAYCMYDIDRKFLEFCYPPGLQLRVTDVLVACQHSSQPLAARLANTVLALL